jgi:hypothetical protein
MTMIEHPSGPLPPPSAAVPEVGPQDRPADGRADRRPAHRVRDILLAASAYLVLSIFIWWHVWSSHPTSTTTCGCGDSSLFTWFLAWPAYAISHGLNPLYSTALFHPVGINLLSNTAEVGIGVVLAPVTWLFGPIATLNVALTLSPALSALAMFVLIRRWVSWSPAAFVGGLLYGFSPFILISLTDAHLMLGMAPIPPLIVACLDELLVRQRRSPVATGAVLGLLVAIQFSIGTEILVLVVIAIVIGAVVMAVYALGHLGDLRRWARYAGRSAVTATVTAAVLLAYPVWFTFAGAGHLSGPVWGPNTLISYGGTNLKDYLLPAAPSAAFADLTHRLGGYQAPTLSGQYFGIGLLAVLALGLVVWRRDRRLWLFVVVGAVSVPLSFGLQFHTWTLWRLFVRFPLMENIIPSRFLLVTFGAAAVMLGPASRGGNSGAPRRRPAAAITALVVAAAALAPIAGYDAGGVPLTTQAVVLPTWFRTVAPHLPGRQVILAFPVPFALLQSAMTWQAVDGMAYDMVGGGGPDSIASRQGKERAGQTYISAVSIAGATQPITRGEVIAVRQALDGWGVTTVVVPDPSGLPLYERLRQVRLTVVLMTAATGERPIRQADAWVWTTVNRAGRPVLTPMASTACDRGPADGPVASIARSTACVVASAPVPAR